MEIMNMSRFGKSTFLEDLDYRKDGPKAFSFLSALNGKRIQASKQPIEISGKLLTSEKDIVKAFNKFYCGVSNFYPRSRYTKKALSPTSCSPEWNRLFNSSFTDRVPQSTEGT